MMTKAQGEKIRRMRNEGLGYVRIAHILEMPEGTVRSFCQRHNLSSGVMYEKNSVSEDGEHHCLYCGKIVPQNPGRKEKKFCSAECRVKWWNSHPDRVHRKAYYDFVCKYCGKPFTAYGNSKRKYCCRECFISDRFGGDCR